MSLCTFISSWTALAGPYCCSKIWYKTWEMGGPGTRLDYSPSSPSKTFCGALDLASTHVSLRLKGLASFVLRTVIGIKRATRGPVGIKGLTGGRTPGT